MTAPELRAKLTEFGVPYSEDAKKADLQRIHDEALEAGVFDGETKEEAARTPEMEPAADSGVPEAIEEVAKETKGRSATRYEVVSRLEHDGTAYEPGDSVELPEEVARHLLTEKVIK